MATDRRWGIRKPVEVDVVIDNQPACLLQGRIGNVSVGGLFVRTEPGGLVMNTAIELVLMLQQENGMRVYRMPAVVARITRDGAGLRFDQYDVGAFRTLVVLLLACRRGAAPGGPTRAKFRAHAAVRPAVPAGGARGASVLEGTTGGLANAPAAPVTATSPVHGESH